MSVENDAEPLPPLTVAELSELAGGLAHELRNPLSTMMIHLKLLAEDLSDPTVSAEDMRRRALVKVATLRKEAERLQALFDDFLNVTGPYRLQRQAINLNALVRRLAEFVDPLARSRNVRIQLSAGEAELIVPADEKLLSQALLNLVINAQEAMPEGGTLRMATRREGGQAVIDIQDEGAGIAPQHKERIFRPFFSTKGTGTGLGLSVTRRIVLEHGGWIGFESDPARGTTFTIRLPIDPDG